MSVLRRNNVTLSGNPAGPAILFAHGFGCDQQMWRHVAPAFEADHRVILFDHVGAGRSVLSAFHPQKYARLEGYAEDIIEIARELRLQDAIFVGHSVSAMMGILAAAGDASLFRSLVLVGPSPCYMDDHDAGYTGGFQRADLLELLTAMDANHLGWSMTMAPVIMGNAHRPELGEELANSFCRSDPTIARHFAEATFLSDYRHILADARVPALILQCSEDLIAPQAVGEYVHARMPGSTLVTLQATGHCPNLSAPEETIAAIRHYLLHR